MSLFELLELEEQVGRAWHRLAGAPASYSHHRNAAVELAPLRRTLGVFFRALGGDPALRVMEATAASSAHRLSWRQRLAMPEERLTGARRDEEALRLPPVIDCFADSALNRDLYFWLAAFLGEAARAWITTPPDPLQADLVYMCNGARTSLRACRRYPGLAGSYRRLCLSTLDARPTRRLPSREAELEAVLRALLGGPPAPSTPAAEAMLRAVGEGGAALAGLSAPRNYRRLLPVPVWGLVATTDVGAPRPDDGDETGGGGAEDDQEGRRYAAKREESEQSERDDALILNRFEKILACSEMVNVNRATEDEEEDAARRAADDHEHLSLGRQQRKAATRLKLELDLRPSASVGGALRGEATYPEWDFRKAVLLPDHCRVIERTAERDGETWRLDEAGRRRVRRVRRQFEALRPRRVLERRQLDGFDLDTDAAVRARSELAATGIGSEQIFEAHRSGSRDFAVSILVDASLSTDAWVDNRRVLDVEKEALTVLVHGLAGCGDTCAIDAFTSRRRESVRIATIKTFEERLDDTVQGRIAALRPGAYTRIGAALRHVTRRMAKRPESYRLILLLTDGKPNDMDHYEGRYGVEDTRMAVREARRSGVCVFAITIDRKARDYVPYLFGRGGYAIVGHAARLPSALPMIYRHLTS